MSNLQLLQSTILRSGNSSAGIERPVQKIYEINSNNGAINTLDKLSNTSLIWDFAVPRGFVWSAKDSFFRYKIKVLNKLDGAINQGRLVLKLDGEPDGPATKINYDQELTFDEDNGKEYSVALSYNCGGSPFQYMKLSLGNTSLDTINNFQLIDSMVKRMTETQDTIQFSGESIDPSWWKRHRAISKQLELDSAGDTSIEQSFILSDDIYSCEDGSYEFLYRPSVSVFGQPALPPGQYQIEVKTLPKEQILNRFFTTLSNSIDPAVDLKVEIELKFYICTVESPQDLPESVMFEYDSIELQNYDVGVQSGGSNGSAVVNLKKSTKAIAIGFQSTKNFAGNSSMYPHSQLIGQTQDPDHQELEILKTNNRCWIAQQQIEYNGVNQPLSPFMIPENSSEKDLMREIYFWNKVQMGDALIRKSHEKYGDWMYLGPYIYYNIVNDNCNSRVNSNFVLKYEDDGGLEPLSPIKHLAFLFSKKKCKVPYNRFGQTEQVLVLEE